jgi:hypothetical protein
MASRATGSSAAEALQHEAERDDEQCGQNAEDERNE